MRPMPRTRPSLPALALALLAAAPGCGEPGRGEPTDGGPRVLRIGHFAAVTHVHGLVAHALTRQGKGWFEERLGPGVKVEWLVFNAGPSAMEALLSGAGDLTYVGPNPAINAHHRTGGQEIRVVAGATLGGSGLVVQGSSTAKGPADFRGKRLGTPQLGNTQDVACRAWLVSGGLRVTLAGGDATVVPASHADLLTLFQKGDLDGAWTVEPWLTRMERDAGGRVLVLEPDAVTTVLASSRAFLDGDRALARRVVEAHGELTRWIAAHPAEARALVAAELQEITKIPISAAILEASWPRMRFDDAVDPAAFDAFTRAAVSAGLLEGTPDLSRLVDRP
jgi:NitT/TauT family transport system substrate-binding protein